MIVKIANKTSELVSSAIVDKLRPITAIVKTLTYENGKEFAGYKSITQKHCLLC